MDQSSFVAKSVLQAALAPASRVLDAPSGFGRHALWLAGIGHHVTALDIDGDRIKQCQAATGDAPASGSIQCVVANALGPLPFAPATFDAVVVVHFVAHGLLARVATLLRPGGYLIYETFGGQGQNWRDLPRPGQTRAEIEASFDLLHYHERPAGPDRQAVAVRLFARLKRSANV